MRSQSHVDHSQQVYARHTDAHCFDDLEVLIETTLVEEADEEAGAEGEAQLEKS